jgi:hypothetical protein
VYLCRPGERNEELRYSLRSLRNLPHDRVWIAGGWPRWVRTETLKANRLGSKYRLTTNNLRAAAEHPEVSDRFIVMNDDFFVMRPIASVPPLHRGPITPETMKRDRYTRSMDELVAYLRGFGFKHPLSYELHIPMVMSKRKVLQMFDLDCPPIALDRYKRSLYGNIYGVGGTLTRDCKVKARREEFRREALFLSTNDVTFNSEPVGAFIRETFPDPSPYEGDR